MESDRSEWGDDESSKNNWHEAGDYGSELANSYDGSHLSESSREYGELDEESCSDNDSMSYSNDVGSNQHDDSGDDSSCCSSSNSETPHRFETYDGYYYDEYCTCDNCQEARRRRHKSIRRRIESSTPRSSNSQ